MKDEKFLKIASILIVVGIILSLFVVTNIKSISGLITLLQVQSLQEIKTNASITLKLDIQSATVVGGSKAEDYINLAHTNDYADFSVELPSGTYILNLDAKDVDPAPTFIKLELDEKNIGTISLDKGNDKWIVKSILLGFISKGKHNLRFTFLNDFCCPDRNALIKNIELIGFSSSINPETIQKIEVKEPEVVRISIKINSTEKFVKHIDFSGKYATCPTINVTKSILTIIDNVGDKDDFEKTGIVISPKERFSDTIFKDNVIYRSLINRTLHYITFNPNQFFSSLEALELDKNNITHLRSSLKIRYQDVVASTSKSQKNIQWENTPANDCNWKYLDFNPKCIPEGKGDSEWKETECSLTGATKVWSKICNKTTPWSSFALVNMKNDNLDRIELTLEGFDEKYFEPKDNVNEYKLEHVEVPHEILKEYYKNDSTTNKAYCSGIDILITPEIKQGETQFLEKELPDIIDVGTPSDSDADNNHGYIEETYYESRVAYGNTSFRECRTTLCPFWIKVNDTDIHVVNITLKTSKEQEIRLLYQNKNGVLIELESKKIMAGNFTTLSWAVYSKDFADNAFRDSKQRYRFLIGKPEMIVIDKIETSKLFSLGTKVLATPKYDWEVATYYLEWIE